jgi:hypothetical protein
MAGRTQHLYRLVTLGAFGACGACHGVPAPAAGAMWSVPLPAAHAAAVVAGALREALPDADPLPGAAGALLQWDGATFRVAYAVAATGIHPRANHRIRLALAAAPTAAPTVCLQAAPDPSSAGGDIEFCIASRGCHSHVSGRARRDLCDRVGAALSLAVDPDAAVASAVETNLGVLIVHQLATRAAAAAAAGDQATLHTCRQRLGSWAATSPWQLCEQGDDAAQSGDFATAIDSYAVAFARSHDPQLRAALAARLQAAQHQAATPRGQGVGSLAAAWPWAPATATADGSPPPSAAPWGTRPDDAGGSTPLAAARWLLARERDHAASHAGRLLARPGSLQAGPPMAASAALPGRPAAPQR